MVQVSSIELTPENPTYAGGKWELDGMRSEHIVATAIYYCDVINVTESRLRFRQEAARPRSKNLALPPHNRAV